MVGVNRGVDLLLWKCLVLNSQASKLLFSAVQDFTGGGIHALPSRPQHSIGNSQIDSRVRELVQEMGCEKSCDLIEEMIITALKIGRDNLGVADLKLFNRSLKELRTAAKVFAPYRDRRKVVVFGSARTGAQEPESLAAEEFSRKMQERAYMIITGGGDGIMGAAQKGAGRENSFGLNIRLPFEQRANETIHGDRKLINFNYFFTRKLNFVKETHAVALFPGGFGTMDEGFEVLTLMQTGKARIIPVVMVDKPGGCYWKTWLAFVADYLLKLGLVSAEDFNFFKVTESVDEAVEEICHFYSTYHSYRWVGSRLVLRLNRPLSEQALVAMNAEFIDICGESPMIQDGALPEELDESETTEMPRIILSPIQKNFGRFRQLIDAINRRGAV